MKRFILAVTVFLLVGSIADVMAGSYTITTTAAQDVKLNRLATFYSTTPEMVIKQSAINYIKGTIMSLNDQQRQRLLKKLDDGTLDAQTESDLQAIIDAHGN